eukprot:CAMPEP_0185034264 /NCGR_PEP_ID=MMETSP1103-20130426/23970_1 /TAXON_ID=36769 /ORGANISM="Paraphysomonas bandaiensis, Strain Caron Lab Isolate" /LENGTH=671 /DNA_ID=CAMNT_0027570847 /DNA_START=237 /DNA_END=2252 /DNA_ORIENTATION=-
MAYELMERIVAFGNVVTVNICDMKDYDLDSLESENVVLILCSTWTGGTVPELCEPFMAGLQDLANDFRVSKNLLDKVKFAVMGLGGKVYGENFCKSSLDIHNALVSLGASPLLGVVYGDDASDLSARFTSWSCRVESSVLSLCPSSGLESQAPVSASGGRRNGKVQRLKGSARKSSPPSESCGDCSCGEPPVEPATRPKKKKKQKKVIPEEEELEEEDIINNTFVCDSDSDDEGGVVESKGEAEGLVDVEDLGTSMANAEEESRAVGREMVTKLQRKALTKEGYKIIGTHSAVKMCRWTKNQMRGRGGCYKHSFYGITSYQCMEATPSLACANKCVFCWRHHKNPVGTEWRWKTDSPDMIVSQAISEHQAMVNQMRGVPGVLPERFKEAFTVRHCALSLVGEPIMYPHINEMVKQLHDRKISTFLVTNAQFPEAIRDMDPVTQLYVSVDAATSESMKAIDRPLFKDFWQRFRTSLVHMREKRQRTVYRMTLVKSWNMDEVQQYSDLIAEGCPDFIEIKAVTYCGKSDASSLTMQNVPWHHEVCDYAEAISANLKARNNNNSDEAVYVPGYSIATEHEHSCCVLLAREDKFKVDGEWYTWIDYNKFDELIAEYYASGGEKKFTSSDYMAKTPSWALYKSAERGFDPVESRWRRNKAGAIVEIEYKASDSGCG